MSQTHYGNMSSETWAIATLFSTTSKDHAKGHTDFVDEVYGWMMEYVKVKKPQLSDSFIEIAKCHGDHLSQKGNHQETMKHYNWLWETSTREFGETDERTTMVLDQMVTALQKSGSSTDYLELSIKQLKVAENTLRVWDVQRTKAVLRLAGAYETADKPEKIYELYPSAIKQLTGALSERSGEATFAIHEQRITLIIAFASFYFRIFDRENGILLLKEFWEKFRPDVNSLRSPSPGLLTQLISLAELLRSVDMNVEAEQLYSVLWTHLKQSNELGSSAEFAYKAGSGLVQLRGQGHGDPKEKEGILKELVDILNPSGIRETNEVGLDAFIQLAHSYEEASEWVRLIEICEQALRRVWPAILTCQSTDTLTLPRDSVEKAVALVYLLARAKSKKQDVRSACNLYRIVHRAFQTTLMPNTQPRVLQAFRDYTTFCQANGCSEEAITSSRSYFGSLEKSAGLSQTCTRDVGLLLADIYTKEKRTDEAVGVYNQISSALLQAPLTPQTFDVLSSIYSIYEKTSTRDQHSVEFYDSFWDKLSGVSDFKQFGVEPNPDMMFGLYEKRRGNLERYGKSETNVLDTTQHLLQHYRTLRGENDTYYIKTMLAYAQLLGKTKGKGKESMEYYEKLLGHSLRMTETEENTTTILQIQQSLATLYLSENTSETRAVDMYQWLFHEHKATHGLTHCLTLGALQHLVQFSTGRESSHVVTDLLQTTTIEMLAESLHSDERVLFGNAVQIAKMFKALAMAEVAMEIVGTLRHYSRLSQKDRREFDKRDARFTSLVFSNSQGLMTERRYQLFFSAIETVIKTSGTLPSEDQLYHVSMGYVLQEYEYRMTWLTATKFGERLDVVLAAGARLRAFLRKQGRSDEFKDVGSDLRTIFQREFETFQPDKNSNTGIPLKFTEDMIEEFYEQSLNLFEHSDHGQISLVDVGLKRVEACITQGDVESAFIIAVWTHRFMPEENKLANTLHLLFQMSSEKVKTTSNTILKNDITKFNQLILQEVLSSQGEVGMSWVSVNLTDIHRLLLFLSGDSRWTLMSTILEQLWDSRSEQDTWSPQIVTAIGCRLVDVYMKQAENEEALRLLERIHYNHTRVFGFFHPETLQFCQLLCKIFNTAGYYNKAITLCEQLLRGLTEHHNANRFTKEEASQLIFSTLDLLKFAHHKKNTLPYRETIMPVFRQLEHMYLIKNSRWNELADFDGWCKKPLASDDKSLIWQPPSMWGLLEDQEEHSDRSLDGKLGSPKASPSLKEPNYLKFSRSSFASLFE